MLAYVDFSFIVGKLYGFTLSCSSACPRPVPLPQLLALLVHALLFSITTFKRTRCHTYNPSTQKAEAGGLL